MRMRFMKANPHSLHAAARYGDLDDIQALLDQNTDINSKDACGWSPLHTAAYHNQMICIRYLIERNAYLNAKTNAGLTPTHVAAMNGHNSSLECLLEAGADSNLTDLYRTSPLQMAAEKGHLSCSTLLAQYGANINSIDYLGNTPLHFALRTIKKNLHDKIIQRAIVKFLLEQDADIFLKNKHGKTALDFAKQHDSLLPVFNFYFAKAEQNKLESLILTNQTELYLSF